MDLGKFVDDDGETGREDISTAHLPFYRQKEHTSGIINGLQFSTTDKKYLPLQP